MFYQTVQDVWAAYESSRALGIPTPVVLSYMMAKALLETGLESKLIQKTTKTE